MPGGDPHEKSHGNLNENLCTESDFPSKITRDLTRQFWHGFPCGKSIWQKTRS